MIAHQDHSSCTLLQQDSIYILIIHISPLYTISTPFIIDFFTQEYEKCTDNGIHTSFEYGTYPIRYRQIEYLNRPPRVGVG